MRLKPIISIIMSLLALTVLLAGCIQDDSSITATDSSDLEKLVGTWRYSGETYVSTISFYKNFSLYSNSTIFSTQEVHKDWGEFWFSENKLCMHSPHGASGAEETYCYNYVFSENNKKLTLTSPGLTDSVLLKIK